MAEVRVKIGADIRDLQKGVRDAQKEVAGLSNTARRASGSLGGAAKSLDEIKESARRAIEESKKFRESLEESGSKASMFGGIVRGVFATQIVGQLASEIRDKLGAALTSATTAARETREEFSRLYGQVSDFKALSGTVRVFENRDQILEEGKRIQEQIAEIDRRIESLGADSRQAGFELLGIDIEELDEAGLKLKGLFSESQRANNDIIAVQKQQRAELQGQFDVLSAQLDRLDGANRIETQRADSALKTREELEKQAEALKRVKEQQAAILELRAAANAAVGVTTPFVDRSGPKASPAVPGRTDKVFDESATSAAADFAREMRGLDTLLSEGIITSLDATNERLNATRGYLSLLANQGLVNTEAFRQFKSAFDELALEQQQAAINAQIIQGNDLFTQFGVTGVTALADIALGFEKLENIGNIVGDIIKQLIRDLIAAAAKAAILSLLFPGASQAAGGFKALFKQNLGLIPGLASGGIVTKPTLSLIGEAGPEAVVPLSKLSSMGGGSVRVEPFSVTVRGGDLVLAFQQARSQTARNIGNIPLK